VFGRLNFCGLFTTHLLVFSMRGNERMSEGANALEADALCVKVAF